MRRLRVLLCILSLSGVALGERRADPAAAPEALRRPLTLEDCLRLAEAAAPTAAGFRARLLQAQADVTTARTWPNPLAAYTAQDLGDPARTLHQQTLSYPLLFAYTRTAQLAAARAGQARTEAAVDADRRLLRIEVGRAYYDLLLLEALLRVEEEAVGLSVGAAALAAQRKALGDTSALDVDRARAEEMEARRALELAERRRDVERLAFSITLGAERPVPVTLAPGWPGDLPGDLALPGAALQEQVDGLVARALVARPDLRQAQAEVRQARAGLSLERLRAVPLQDLLLSGGLREAQDQITGVVSLSLPLPVFDFNQGPRRRAAATLLGLEAEQERVRRRIALEVESALVAFAGARRAREEIARPLLSSREQVMQRTRGLFVAGEVGFLDLLGAQRDLLGARRALVQAERDVAVERWRLLQAASR